MVIKILSALARAFGLCTISAGYQALRVYGAQFTLLLKPAIILV